MSKTYRERIDDLVAGRPFDHRYIDELHKLYNHTYTAGFFINCADHEFQRYDEEIINIFTLEFVGTIKGVKSNCVLLMPRNAFKLAIRLKLSHLA